MMEVLLGKYGEMINPEFWAGKSVFVTGHTGFKGSWLCLWLQRLGSRVTGYALSPKSAIDLFELASVADGMESRIGDIRELELLNSAMRKACPQIVIHLAAQALVRPSYLDPVGTFATNVMGTVNVLESIRQTESVRAAVIVTSDKCYENREWVWGYREDEHMGGHDPYSSSKGCAELVTSAYRRSYFSNKTKEVSVASARAGNVIGGGDWAKDRLVPDFMRAFIEKRPVIVRNPKAIRPWQHVLEPLHGYLLLAEKLYAQGKACSGGWNFGPDESDMHSVSWVADELVRRWGNGAQWTLDTKENPHESLSLKLDCAKARHFLGWKPQINLGTALDWTVQWYKGFQSSSDVRRISLQEIERYEQIKPL